MTHQEFYRDYIKEHLVKDDKPYNREGYNMTKDNLYKAGMITDKQYNNWVYPNNKYFR